MRIGVLVSGGDCPGLNAAIRGLTLRGADLFGHEILGFRDGWRGVFDDDAVRLDRAAVRGLAGRGGTVIGTSRVGPWQDGRDGVAAVGAAVERNGLDGIVAIGGNGTQTVAHLLSQAGIPMIGMPKTIDNDLGGTDVTFGFDTAVSIATEGIDRLRTTGESHQRCMVLEVMGRHAGWIALHAGTAGGAHTILIPEFPESLDDISAWVTHVRDRGRTPLVVVAEGFTLPEMDTEYSRKGLDGFGRPRLGGIAEVLAPLIEERTGIETRATVLGHLQRGGVPTSADRVLATRCGFAAADAVEAGDWGTMVSVNRNAIEQVPLADAAETLKAVPAARYQELRMLFG
ncbi:6-phosphofructokinase [Leucobacter sp. M11]|uniref:6-phosphofructokinase n=1 Tax=Leucobacter sp. M11 TaxID=2993565 RepID=UPI002D806087|nr:ATP-dependent 6-phosphofructokinase [Leucobacter sp. M11]MEB4615704.1 ATP-dependent 6-phosphofructokinase [Leucobacter sp. M11]